MTQVLEAGLQAFIYLLICLFIYILFYFIAHLFFKHQSVQLRVHLSHDLVFCIKFHLGTERSRQIPWPL